MNDLVERYLKYAAYKARKIRERKTPVGVANDLIDLIFHPLFGQVPGAEILDFLAHSAVEGEFNIRKFVKYNLRSTLGVKSRVKKREIRRKKSRRR